MSGNSRQRRQARRAQERLAASATQQVVEHISRTMPEHPQTERNRSYHISQWLTRSLSILGGIALVASFFGFGVNFYIGVAGVLLVAVEPLRLIWISQKINSRWLRIVLTGLVILLCSVFIWLGYINIYLKQEVSAEELSALSPNLSIEIFADPRRRTIQTPLYRYLVLIQNKNIESAPLTDLSLKFRFRNIVQQVKPRVLIPSSDFNVELREFREKRPDGSEIHVEGLPQESALAKHFALEIQKLKINDKEEHTNVVTLFVDRWPEGAGYDVEAIVDLSKPPTNIISGDAGKYTGRYVFHIKGKKFAQSIEGTIPESNSSD